jgi:hypothetical protein
MVRTIKRRVRTAWNDKDFVAGTCAMALPWTSGKKRALLHVLRQGCRISGLSSGIEIRGPRMEPMATCPTGAKKIDESRFEE